jgi:hypothetical protein
MINKKILEFLELETCDNEERIGWRKKNLNCFFETALDSGWIVMY